MPDEEWRPVKDFPGYEVSNLGRVRSWFRWRGADGPRLLAGAINKRSGIHTVMVQCPDGSHRTIAVHQLVARTFLGDPPTPQHEVNHKSGVRSDNSAGNLEWVTPRENIHHAWQIGLQKPSYGHRRLTDEQVVQIRHFGQTMTIYQLAELFPVSAAHILRILDGDCWTTISPIPKRDPGLFRRRGIASPCAKLTEQQVREIRQLKGTMSWRQIGLRYGISDNSVGDILRGRTWGHVTP